MITPGGALQSKIVMAAQIFTLSQRNKILLVAGDVKSVFVVCCKCLVDKCS